MHKKPTITLDERVYAGLHSVISLEEGYRQMASDEAREAEALEWSEATVGLAVEQAVALQLGLST